MKNSSVEIKKIIRCDIPISYPNVSESFIFHTKSRKMNIGRLLNGKWGIHYILLIQDNPRLIYYTTTETKMLSIVEMKKDNTVPLY